MNQNQINPNVLNNLIEHCSMKVPPYYSSLVVTSESGETKNMIVRGKGNHIDLGKPDNYDLDKLLQAGVKLEEIQMSLFEPHSIDAESSRLRQAVSMLSKINKLQTSKTQSN